MSDRVRTFHPGPVERSDVHALWRLFINPVWHDDERRGFSGVNDLLASHLGTTPGAEPLTRLVRNAW